MERKKGTETAFPLMTEKEYSFGMSKRFYAACAAMQGLISNDSIKLSLGPDNPNDNSKVISIAYLLADELLKQENQ